jgi:hypothetical protein
MVVRTGQLVACALCRDGNAKDAERERERERASGPGRVIWRRRRPSNEEREIAFVVFSIQTAAFLSSVVSCRHVLFARRRVMRDAVNLQSSVSVPDEDETLAVTGLVTATSQPRYLFLSLFADRGRVKAFTVLSSFYFFFQIKSLIWKFEA